MRGLVCHRSSPLLAADDGYTGQLLFRGRSIHSAGISPGLAASGAYSGGDRFRPVPGELCLDVEQREAAKPGEAGASHHECSFLVVL